MKDLLELLLKGARRYLPRLLAVVSAPRTNILRLVREPADPLKDALVFMLLSYAVRIAVQAPMLPPEFDLVTTYGPIALVSFFVLLVIAASVVLALKIVGVAGKFEKTFIATCYILGPIGIWAVFCQLLVFGMLIKDAPELAYNFFNVIDSDPAKWDAYLDDKMGKAIVLLLLSAALVVVPIGWLVWCWGVFRDMHQLSWARTIISLLLAAAFFVVIAGMEEFILQGLFQGNAPRVL